MSKTSFTVSYKLNRIGTRSEPEALSDLTSQVGKEVFGDTTFINYRQTSVFSRDIELWINAKVNEDNIETKVKEMMGLLNEKMSKMEEFNGRVPVVGRTLKITSYKVN